MLNEFFKVFVSDLKRCIRNKHLYICLLLMAISCIAILYRNVQITEISNQKMIGTLNSFIYGAVYDNPIMALFAPFIASFVFCGEFLTDSSEPYQKMPKQTAYRFKALSISIRTGLFFMFSYMLVLLIMLCLDSDPSIRQNYFAGSLFITVYERSMLLYCICFIAFSMIYAGAYSLLAFGLSNLFIRLYEGVILPGVVSYLLIYVAAALVPNVSNSVFAYIVPFQTYDTTSGMEANRYFWQIATVFAAALIINAIVIRKNGWKEV